jgi:hypothetical protein
MAKKVINVGITANDTSGDPLRAAGTIINENFTELYNALGGESGAPLSIVSKILAGQGIIVSSPNGDVLITNKIATADELGGIRAGTGITIDDAGVASVNVYELPKASNTILGGIRVGDRLSINAQGVLSADPGAYTLPKATDSALGGIKIGTGLSIDGGGIVSISNSNRLIAGPSEVVLDADGNMSVPGTVTSSNPIKIIGGGTALEPNINFIQMQWASDVANPDTGKNQYIWADADGAHINTSLFDSEGIVYDNQWWFKNDGVLQLPTGGDIVDSTGTTVLAGGHSNILAIGAGPNTVIYTTNGEYVRAVKLFVFAEKFANGYESQACEIIGTVDQNANLIYTSIYGVVYTGENPLFTIDSSYDLPTQSYIISATPTGADTINIRTHVTEMYGTD